MMAQQRNLAFQAQSSGGVGTKTLERVPELTSEPVGTAGGRPAHRGFRRRPSRKGQPDSGGLPFVAMVGGPRRLGPRPTLPGPGYIRVTQICPRWNPLTSWMRQIEDFQRAA